VEVPFTDPEERLVSVLVLTGSARRDAHTRRLGAEIAAAAADGVLAPRLTALPFFDEDLEATPPASVEQLRAQVAAADVVVVVTPEYNGTIPGLLGNAIDWLSRPYGAGALRDKRVVAVAASPGDVGGARALVALRTVLGNAGAHVPAASLTVPAVHTRFDADGADAALAAEIGGLLDAVTVGQPAAA
jgi:chromate reductase